MGDVVQFTSRPPARRTRMLATLAHPALKWTTAADDEAAAHRAAVGGGTVCGLDGPLELAGRGAGLCPVCCPPDAQAGP